MNTPRIWQPTLLACLLACATPAALAAPPRLAIVGFQPAADQDPRDVWLATAAEEFLARRLRRLPQLTLVPVARLHVARQELGTGRTAPPPWPVITRAAGCSHWLTATTAGTPRDLQLTLHLHDLSNPDAKPKTHTLPADRWATVLDTATDWVLGQFKLEVPAEARTRLYRAPTQSTSAAEYYARAVRASRAGDNAAALRYAGEAVDYDRRLRPALALRAQLEMQVGPRGGASAARHLRMLNDLARIAEDPLDRASAELGRSLLLQSTGSSDAAKTRADTALTLARESQDAYGELAALGWLADLLVTWQAAKDPNVPPETLARRRLERLKTAARFQHEVVDKLLAVSDRVGALTATARLALLHDQLAEPDEGQNWHRRTAELARELNAPAHEAGALVYLSASYRRAGQLKQAREVLERALEVTPDTGRPQVRMLLASLLTELEDHPAALQQLEQAWRVLKSSDEMLAQLECLDLLAAAQSKLGQKAKARRTLQDAVDIAHAFGLPLEKELRERLKALQ
jgi:hypothetical protein